jgi:hypothetical protein
VESGYNKCRVGIGIINIKNWDYVKERNLQFDRRGSDSEGHDLKFQSYEINLHSCQKIIL